jgi:hypothetical protein
VTTIDLAAKQASASLEAARLAEALDELQAKLTAAVAKEDFTTADQIKAKIGPAQAEWILAEAQVRAFADVLAQVATQEAERMAAEAAERRLVEAQAQLEAAQGVEHMAKAEFERHWADVEPGVAAVRESMSIAMNAERALDDARRSMHQAQVTLGLRSDGLPVYALGEAKRRIDEDPVLARIFHGTAGR